MGLDCRYYSMTLVYRVVDVRYAFQLNGHCPSCTGAIFPALVEDTDGKLDIGWLCNGCKRAEILNPE